MYGRPRELRAARLGLCGDLRGDQGDVQINPNWRRDVLIFLAGVALIVLLWLVLAWPDGVVGLVVVAWGVVVQVVAAVSRRPLKNRR